MNNAGTQLDGCVCVNNSGTLLDGYVCGCE